MDVYFVRYRGLFKTLSPKPILIAEESIGGIRTVRSFAREAHEHRALSSLELRLLFNWQKSVLGLGRGSQDSSPLLDMDPLLRFFGMEGHLLASGEMDFGELTSFMLYTFTVAFSLGALSGLYEDFAKAIGASDRVFELLEREPEQPDGTEVVQEPRVN